MHMVTISIACLVGAFAGGLIFGFGVHVGQQLPPTQAVYHTNHPQQHGQHHANQAGNQHRKEGTS
jgi:hypothetical protein